MKASKLESGVWIETTGWGFKMEDLDNDESVLGLLLFYNTGIIKFQPFFWFMENFDMNGEAVVHKFQVIKR